MHSIKRPNIKIYVKFHKHNMRNKLTTVSAISSACLIREEASVAEEFEIEREDEGSEEDEA